MLNTTNSNSEYLHNYIRKVAKQEQESVDTSSVYTGTIEAAQSGIYTIVLNQSDNSSSVLAIPIVSEDVYDKDDSVYLLRANTTATVNYFIVGKVNAIQEAFFNLTELERFNPNESKVDLSFGSNDFISISEDANNIFNSINELGYFQLEVKITSKVEDNDKIIIYLNYTDESHYAAKFEFSSYEFIGQPGGNNYTLVQKKIFHLPSNIDIENIRIEKVGDFSVAAMNIVAGSLLEVSAAYQNSIAVQNDKNYFEKDIEIEDDYTLPNTVTLTSKVYYNNKPLVGEALQYYWFLKDVEATNDESVDYLNIEGAGNGWRCLNNFQWVNTAERKQKVDANGNLVFDESGNAVYEFVQIRLWDNKNNFITLNKKNFIVPNDPNEFVNFSNFVNKVKCIVKYFDNFIESDLIDIYNYDYEQFSATLTTNVDPVIIINRDDEIQLECKITNNNSKSNLSDFVYKYEWHLGDAILSNLKDSLVKVQDKTSTTLKEEDKQDNVREMENDIEEYYCKVSIYHKNDVIDGEVIEGKQPISEEISNTIQVTSAAAATDIQEEVQYKYYIADNHRVTFKENVQVSEDTELSKWSGDWDIYDSNVDSPTWSEGSFDKVFNDLNLFSNKDKTKEYFVYYTKRTIVRQGLKILRKENGSFPQIARSVINVNGWKNHRVGDNINQLNTFNQLTKNGEEDGIHYAEIPELVKDSSTPIWGTTYYKRIATDSNIEYEPITLIETISFKETETYYVLNEDGSYSMVAKSEKYNYNIDYYKKINDTEYQKFVVNTQNFDITVAWPDSESGPFYENIDNKLFINATYIRSGTLEVKDKFYADIEKNDVTIAGFTVSENNISASSGFFKAGTDEFYLKYFNSNAVIEDKVLNDFSEEDWTINLYAYIDNSIYENIGANESKVNTDTSNKNTYSTIIQFIRHNVDLNFYIDIKEISTKFVNTDYKGTIRLEEFEHNSGFAEGANTYTFYVRIILEDDETNQVYFYDIERDNFILNNISFSFPVVPTSILYSSPETFYIDTPNFSVIGTNASIKGAITATSLKLEGTQIDYNNDIINTPNLDAYIEKDVQLGRDDSTSFRVSTDGLLEAKNAIIYGTTYSSKGEIGGWEISSDSIYKEGTLVYAGSNNKFPSAIEEEEASSIRFAAGSDYEKHEIISSFDYQKGSFELRYDTGEEYLTNVSIEIESIQNDAVSIIVQSVEWVGGIIIANLFATSEDTQVGTGDYEVKIIYYTINKPPKFYVLQDGSLFSTAAKLTENIIVEGKITAKSLELAGDAITSGALQSRMYRKEEEDEKEYRKSFYKAPIKSVRKNDELSNTNRTIWDCTLEMIIDLNDYSVELITADNIKIELTQAQGGVINRTDYTFKNPVSGAFEETIQINPINIEHEKYSSIVKFTCNFQTQVEKTSLVDLMGAPRSFNYISTINYTPVKFNGLKIGFYDTPYFLSKNFKILENGDVSLEGSVTAKSGKIGGLTIQNSNLIADYFKIENKTSDNKIQTEIILFGEEEGIKTSLRNNGLDTLYITAETLDSKQISCKSLAADKISLLESSINGNGCKIAFMENASDKGGYILKIEKKIHGQDYLEITIDKSPAITISGTFQYSSSLDNEIVTVDFSFPAGTSTTTLNHKPGWFWGIKDNFGFIKVLDNSYSSPTKSINITVPKSGNIVITGNLLPFKDITTNISTLSLGESETRWNNIYANNIYGNTSALTDSDKNIKYNIRSISEKYLFLFDKLKPVVYNFINGSSGRTHIGFIAQDVKEAILNTGLTTQNFAGYCEWVKEDGTIGCGLRYEEFIALCVDQIQKNKARIKELEDRLKEIKGE